MLFSCMHWLKRAIEMECIVLVDEPLNVPCVLRPSEVMFACTQYLAFCPHPLKDNIVSKVFTWQMK